MTYCIDGAGYNGVDSAICIAKGKKKKRLRIIVYQENLSALEAEGLALLSCLLECKPNTLIKSDCLILVHAVTTSRDNLGTELFKTMIEEIRKVYKEKNCKLEWISREENLAGKALESRRFKLRNYRRSIINGVKR